MAVHLKITVGANGDRCGECGFLGGVEVGVGKYSCKLWGGRMDDDFGSYEHPQGFRTFDYKYWVGPKRVQKCLDNELPAAAKKPKKTRKKSSARFATREGPEGEVRR